MNEDELNKMTDALIADVRDNWVEDPKTIEHLAGNVTIISRTIYVNGLSSTCRNEHVSRCIDQIQGAIDETRAQMATMLSKIEELAQAIYGRN